MPGGLSACEGRMPLSPRYAVGNALSQVNPLVKNIKEVERLVARGRTLGALCFSQHPGSFCVQGLVAIAIVIANFDSTT